MFYVGAKKEEKREVVIEAHRKRQIFLDCHFDDLGHHLGQKKTVHRIQRSYYWLGIIRDVVDWVRSRRSSSGGRRGEEGLLLLTGAVCPSRLKCVRRVSTRRGAKAWPGRCGP